MELDIKAEEEKTIRRSKRLTKTNAIARYNKPFVMITGNTVKKLNSGNTPGQPDMEPENESNI